MILLLLGCIAGLLCVLFILPTVSTAHHEQIWFYVASDWRVATGSSRELEWDEPLPGQPFPQAYLVRTTQFGPLIMDLRRQVPATASEKAQ